MTAESSSLWARRASAGMTKKRGHQGEGAGATPGGSKGGGAAGAAGGSSGGGGTTTTNPPNGAPSIISKRYKQASLLPFLQTPAMLGVRTGLEVLQPAPLSAQLAPPAITALGLSRGVFERLDFFRTLLRCCEQDTPTLFPGKLAKQPSEWPTTAQRALENFKIRDTPAVTQVRGGASAVCAAITSRVGGAVAGQ